jgi:uncharacterized protein YecT (DUF1311 family)
MKLLVLIMLLFVAATSTAQTQKDPCKGETTFEMKQCAGNRYLRADEELNKVYRQLMSKLDDEGWKTSLKTAQQAWLKYRDTHCEFEGYLNIGGTIHPIVVADCMTSVTTARTKELKQEIDRLKDL